MTGQFRFLRVKNGVSYFASVTLDAVPGGEKVELADALSARPNRDAGEVNRLSANSWVRAAMDGILEAVTHAQQTGLLPGGCHVELTKVLGNDVDTRDDVVRCAAGMATWQALGGPEIDAELENGKWNVLYPAGVEVAVPGSKS